MLFSVRLACLFVGQEFSDLFSKLCMVLVEVFFVRFLKLRCRRHYFVCNKEASECTLISICREMQKSVKAIPL